MPIDSLILYSGPLRILVVHLSTLFQINIRVSIYSISMAQPSIIKKTFIHKIMDYYALLGGWAIFENSAKTK